MYARWKDQYVHTFDVYIFQSMIMPHPLLIALQ